MLQLQCSRGPTKAMEFGLRKDPLFPYNQSLQPFLEDEGLTYGGAESVNVHRYFAKMQQYIQYLDMRPIVYNESMKIITQAKFISPDCSYNEAPQFVFALSTTEVVPSDVHVKWLYPDSLSEEDKHTIKHIEQSLCKISLKWCGQMKNNRNKFWTFHPDNAPDSSDTGVVGDEVEKFVRIGLRLNKHYLRTFRQTAENGKVELDQIEKAIANYYGYFNQVSSYHIRELTSQLENAFCYNMHNSEGKAGIVAMMKLAVGLIDSKKLTIYYHGGSPLDVHGFRVTKAVQEVEAENAAIEAGLMPPLEAPYENPSMSTEMQAPRRKRKRTSSLPDESTSKSRSGGSSGLNETSSTAGTSTISSLSASGRIHSDITVFNCSGPTIIPVLLIEIKPNDICDESQLVKHLLGALMFKKKAFGLIINAKFARLYKLEKRDKVGENVIDRSYKPYEFYQAVVGEEQVVFNSGQLLQLFKDLLIILQYGL